MSYMLLIVEKQGDRKARSLPEGQALYDRMRDYASNLKSRGVLMGTNSLREAAVRLNINGGKNRVVDGPFTESKELVGGYFLLNCETREQALGFAAECPAAAWATIEVRELGPCYE
jgi:hypothetical protein